MTTSLSANQALAVVSHCPFPLLVFDVGGQVPGYNAAFEQLVDPVQTCKLKSRDRLKSDQRPLGVLTVSYTHLTLPTICFKWSSRWSPCQ